MGRRSWEACARSSGSSHRPNLLPPKVKMFRTLWSGIISFASVELLDCNPHKNEVHWIWTYFCTNLMTKIVVKSFFNWCIKFKGLFKSIYLIDFWLFYVYVLVDYDGGGGWCMVHCLNGWAEGLPHFCTVSYFHISYVQYSKLIITAKFIFIFPTIFKAHCNSNDKF